MRRNALAAITLCVLLLAASAAQAAGYVPREERWQFGFAPSLWLPAIDGSVRVRGVASRLDLTSADIFDEVDVSAQLHFEAKRRDWAFIVEPTYLRAEDDSTPAKTEIKYLLTDLLAAYRVTSHWEVLGGLRRVSMDNRIKASGGPRVSQSESWSDLVVGVRYSADLATNWSFLGHIDASGFGIGSGSDLSWNAAAIFFRDFGRNKAFVLGYRLLDIDFEDGSGANRFEFDVRQKGPFFGVNFR